MILVKVFIFEYQNGLETFAPLVKDFDGPSFHTITIICHTDNFMVAALAFFKIQSLCYGER